LFYARPLRIPESRCLRREPRAAPKLQLAVRLTDVTLISENMPSSHKACSHSLSHLTKRAMLTHNACRHVFTVFWPSWRSARRWGP
jgi:hypothetical protein